MKSTFAIIASPCLATNEWIGFGRWVFEHFGNERGDDLAFIAESISMEGEDLVAVFPAWPNERPVHLDSCSSRWSMDFVFTWFFVFALYDLGTFLKSCEYKGGGRFV